MSTTSVAQTSSINQNVSRVVRILMAVAGTSQKELAAELGMDSATMSNSLNGKRRWSLDDVERLSQVFDRPISMFFEPADTLVRNR